MLLTRGLTLVLLGLVLAGCVGSATIEQTSEPPRASFNPDNGGIEGLVTDPEYRPVAGVQLQLIGVKQWVNTTEDGRFAFSDLVPQDYLMMVKAPGFQPKQVPVTVPLGNVTQIRIVLDPVPPPVPYVDPVYRFAGTFQAGAGVRVADRSTNTSNGKRGNAGTYDFTPRGDWQTILVEVVWTPNRAESDMMSLSIVLPEKCGATSMCLGNSMFVGEGKSPLRWRIERPQFEEMRKARPNLTFSSFVGFQYGVYPALDDQGTHDVALYVDQSFIVYGTVGYNGPLPPGYSRVAPP